jgi:hypothetical protein
VSSHSSYSFVNLFSSASASLAHSIAGIVGAPEDPIDHEGTARDSNLPSEGQRKLAALQRLLSVKSDRGGGSGKPAILKLSTCSVSGTTTGALATPEIPPGETGEVHKRTAREAYSTPRCAGPRASVYCDQIGTEQEAEEEKAVATLLRNYRLRRRNRGRNISILSLTSCSELRSLNPKQWQEGKG